MNTIQAIPTEFKGITYRSRLEARWAVFFYAMCGVDQETKVIYEPKTYILKDGTRYLPDFLIKVGEYLTFIEIKPTSFSYGQPIVDKLREVCKQASGTAYYLFKGEPYDALVKPSLPKSQIAQLLLLFGCIATSDYERMVRRLSVNKTSIELEVGTVKIEEYCKIAGTMKFDRDDEYEDRVFQHLDSLWRESKKMSEEWEEMQDALDNRERQP